jgi:bacterioferritin
MSVFCGGPQRGQPVRRRVRQADQLDEFAIAESLRGSLVEEQDHLIALATALGIDRPDAGIAD